MHPRSRLIAAFDPASLSRLIFVACGLLLLLLVFRAAACISAPYPIEPSDAGMLSSAQVVAEGRNIFNVLDGPPYVFNIHSPLFIYLSALAVRLIGPSPFGPRLLAVFFLLGTAGLVSAFVKRRTGSPRAALVAGIFVLLERHFVSRLGLAACDCSAIFLSALGLYLFDSPGRKRLAAPVVFALAYFCKQSAFLAPVAVIIALALSRSWRRVLFFTVSYVALMALGFAVAWFALGKAFFVNTLSYGVTGPFYLTAAVRHVGATVVFYPAAFLAAAGALFDRKRPLLRFLLPAYLLLGGMLAFTAGREGGSKAYSFDLAVVLALSLGLFWPRIEAFLTAPRAPRAATAVALFVFLQLGAVSLGVAEIVEFGETSRMLRGAWPEGKHSARRAFFAREGLVLSRYAGYDLGAPGRNFTTDPHRLGWLLEAGVVDRAPLVDAVKSRMFSAVVIPIGKSHWKIFDEDLKAVVRENYSLQRTFGNDEYYLAPASTAAAPPPS